MPLKLKLYINDDLFFKTDAHAEWVKELYKFYWWEDKKDLANGREKLSIIKNMDEPKILK